MWFYSKFYAIEIHLYFIIKWMTCPLHKNVALYYNLYAERFEFKLLRKQWKERKPLDNF